MRALVLLRSFFVVTSVVGSFGAAAYDKGDTCTIKAPLSVVINSKAGRIETTLDPGSDVEVVAVGEEGRLRVSNGDTKGSVATRDLEAACAGTLQMCRLTRELVVYEKNASDSRSWKIKPGAPVNVLRTGKVWAHVRVDDLEGYAKADELKGRCPLTRGGGDLEASGGEPVTEEVDRGEGPGILFLPFLVEGAAPIGTADRLADAFYDRLSYYRPDAARLPDDGNRTADTPAAWKKHVIERASRARGAGLAYVVVAKVGLEAAKAGAPTAATDGLVVSLAVIDAKTGATVKGVRARPTAKDDAWVETVLKTLLPLLRSAPGAREPQGPKLAPTLPTSTTNAPQAPTTTTANATPDAWPWFANGWGYVALGGAVVAGVGSGVTGALASADNDAANAAAPVDDERQQLRASALQKAIASDSLAVVAGVAAVTSVVVFAGRVGMAE